MAEAERVLVVAHAHPDFSLGGGEVAAYNLFRAYRDHPGVEQAWFLGRADRGGGPTGRIGMRGPGDYVWEQGVSDWHMMRAANRHALTTWFTELLQAMRPTILHAHHFAHLGLEYLRVARAVLPTLQIHLTLHEYMAICKNNGQMVKTEGMKLCSRASLDECNQCFPEHSAGSFWLRRHNFLKHFGLVDGFIAPSRFLRSRYVDWGIAPERITVIENGHQVVDVPVARRPGTDGRRNRFGYFGQINPYKGVDVLLKALLDLTEAQRRGLVLEIHGANLGAQSPAFQGAFEKLLAQLGEGSCVHWVGPYQPHELDDRMGGVDWVVVPSVWWENSPMVIQEAFARQRPVICSNIGGMAEKVRHGVDGIHVPVGSAARWGEALLEAADSPDLWERLRNGIRPPMSAMQSATLHLEWMAGRRPVSRLATTQHEQVEHS